MKSLGIGYHFYQGKYTSAIADILDTDRKTILHIPSPNAGESTKDKYAEVDCILDLIGEVVETDPAYRDAAYRLEEAQRQDRLHELYNRGLECLEDKDWTRGIECFEQVVQEDEIYRDAMARLMEARRQRQLTGLYREGEARFAEGNWDEAVTAFEKMLSLDPTDEWGVTARMREGRRQRDLIEKYAQAVNLYEE